MVILNFIWKTIEIILFSTGRIVAILMGLVLMAIGAGISITIVGAFIGVPLFVIGILLVVRGLF